MGAETTKKKAGNLCPRPQICGRNLSHDHKFVVYTGLINVKTLSHCRNFAAWRQTMILREIVNTFTKKQKKTLFRMWCTGELLHKTASLSSITDDVCMKHLSKETQHERFNYKKYVTDIVSFISRKRK